MLKKFTMFFVIVIIIIAIILYIKKDSISIYKTKTPTSQKGNAAFSPVTNTWYTAWYFEQNEPIYAIPSSYKITPDGVEISKPLTAFQPKTVFYTHTSDLILKFSGEEKIAEKKVIRAGEWDVEATVTGSEKNTFNIHAIKGNPAVYITKLKTALQLDTLRLKEAKKLSETSYLLTTVDTKSFLVSSDKGIKFDAEKKSFTFDATSKTIAISAMPDEFIDGKNNDNLDAINACILNKPEFTDYTYSYNPLTKSYQTDFVFSNSTDKKYLFTAWPHLDTKYTELTNKPTILGTYKTSKGMLSLMCESKLSYKLKTEDLPMNYEDIVTKNPELISQAAPVLKQEYEAFNKVIMPEGVYFKGKYFKQLVDLWMLSRIVKETQIEGELHSRLKDLLVTELDNFTLDKKSLLVFHKKNEFGSERGSDHHFHYGYYTYVYTNFYDQFSSSEQEKVKNLIGNFLTEGTPGLDANNPYPRKTRFLDPYESHSWADGHGLFNDGNNQESTSEALLYWYSLRLWAEKTQSADLKHLAIYTYFSELAGRDSYWFLLNNEYLQKNFQSPMLSLVWGGKSDYATWFSGDEDKIFGIQLLPITPSSFVSFDLSGYDQKEKDRIFSYYDKFFATQPKTANFHQYYFLFAKVNKRQIPNTSSMPQDEYYVKTVDKLIETE